MSRLFEQDLEHILVHAEHSWDALRGQRIFVTGGTGFLGRWMLESLVWANDRMGLDIKVLVLTRDSDSFLRSVPHVARHPAVGLVAGDVRSFEFPPGSFSHVIHMATSASQTLNVQNPLLMLDTIVQGTRRTLDFARHCGAGGLLLTSSGAVYGVQPPEVTHIPEDRVGAPDVTDTLSAYGEGKRLAEHLCSLYNRQYGVRSKIARGFAFVGPHLPLDTHFAVGNFIGDALSGRPIQVKGDGSPHRSYLYAADAVIWLWAILLRGEVCRPYNVGSEEDLTIAQLAEEVARAFEPKPKVEIMASQTPGRPQQRYVPSTARAQAELGLQQFVSLPDAIRRTTSWHKISPQYLTNCSRHQLTS